MLKCMHQLKMMSTDEVSSPNFSERNSAYYERSSRLVADNDSYIRRTNNNNNTNNNNIRNGPFSTASVLSERSSNSNTHQQNNRLPSSSASWYDTVTTNTNGPGGSGNVVASAAGGHHHHYTTIAVTNTSTALISSPPPASFSILATTSPLTTTTTSSLGTALYQRGNSHDSSLLINKRSKLNKLLKASSAGGVQLIGSESPSSLLVTGTLTATATITTTTTTSYINSSCSTISSSSNNNNLSSSSNSTKTITNNNNNSSGGSSGTGNSILNAMTSASTLAISNSSSNSSHHPYGETSANTNAYSSSTSINTTSAIANSTTSHNANRITHHGRSTTSSSRSHSRSPSSYSSSHSSSSSSHASSRSHASSPILGSDLAVTSSSRSGTGARSHMQSVIATPTQGSSLHNTTGGSGGCSSSSSSSSSGSCTATTPVVHSEDNRPLAIRVRNLPARSSDTSLKDGLFHEYKKHGKVTWVKVVGQNSERYALVCFKKPDDVEKALEVSHDKLFFGCKIEVEPYQGYDVEDNEFRPYEAELDEFHPKSTRTLFIGNLEKDITASELRSHFECFGEIIEIDIKKQGMNAYAFCQYSDIVSVVKAMRKMDGEHLGSNRIKLGFGKSMPTNCVWIDGIGDKISESHLQSQFSRYGAVTKVIIDRTRQLALVLYDQIQYAQTAVKEMRGTTLRGRRLQVDFASRECQDAFYEKLEKQQQNSAGRFSRYDSQSRSRASSFSRLQNNEGCSPSNTPGSSSGSSVSGIAAPTLSSAIVAGTAATTTTPIGSVGQLTPSGGASTTTPSRSRGPRCHTIDFDYADIRRFRSYDEYSQGSTASHDEDVSGGTPLTPLHNAFSSGVTSCGLRSDSPLLSRLGPVVGSAATNCASETMEVSCGSGNRRRCDKSPAKQKGDIRFLQKERFHLLEQLEEYPSSGDENIASPRKRIRLDHHHSSSLSSGLLHTTLDANSNCDEIIHDSPLHRKADVRRLSDFGKYQASQSQHYQSQQPNLNRRPSNDLTASSAEHNSARHNSTSSSSSEHYSQHQLHGSGSVGGGSTTVPCKRRRVVGGSNNMNCNTTLISGSAGGVGDDYHQQQHTSRGRGHSLHSHHSHEASCGESPDGSRPGTPLCDERPEVLPTEPRRVPRDRPHEPMVLPLPKFGIQFFQQYRNSTSNTYHHNFHHYHHQQHGMSSSSLASHSHSVSGGGFGLPNSHVSGGSISSIATSGGCNSHSSLSHNLTSSSTVSAASGSGGAQSITTHLPSPSTRYTHWRPPHQHQQQQQQHHHHRHHHGSNQLAAPTSVSTLSPMRSRSLSSNSSDSEAQAHATGGSPSLEERIRTLDEMYERWSGGGNSGGAGTINTNAIKRCSDFSHNSASSWQSREHSSSSMHSASGTGSSPTTTISAAPTRHKFLDLDVNELQPSDIVKSVLAKKSIFDDDLQRLKKNQWFEPTNNETTTSMLSGSIGLPNLGAATKSPIVGSCTNTTINTNRTPAVGGSSSLLQRLSSLSPMNSPQASMSPYNSPSPSPSVGANNFANSSTIIKTPTAMAAATTTSAAAAASAVGSISINATLAGSTAATKGLQYPFPSHPPLPNTAAPAPVAQPPPPAEQQIKPTTEQSTDATTLASTANELVPATNNNNKPKPNIVKSYSVPTETANEKSSATNNTNTTTTTNNAADAVRVLTKSVSVPGSTNVGTVKTKSSPDSAIASGSSSSITSSCSSTASSNNGDNNNKTESDNLKGTKATATLSTPNTIVKKHEKSHKHEKKSKHEKTSSSSSTSTNERRKKSLTSTHRIEEDSSENSDIGEKDSEKEKTTQSLKDKDKERQEREKRERELKKQQQQQQQEKETQERREEQREAQERREAAEKEKIEQAERERLENERRQAQLERERKEREENERKLQAQRERKLEQQRRQKEEREERERQAVNNKEETTAERLKTNVEGQQRAEKENLEQFSTATTTCTSTTEKQIATKTEINTIESSAATTTKHHHYHHSSSGGGGSHKTTRSSPTRHAKRRLSSHESTNSANTTNAESSHGISHTTDDHAKRPRTESQQSTQQTHQSHTKETKKHHHHHKHHSSSSSSHKTEHTSSSSISGAATAAGGAVGNVTTIVSAANEELEKSNKNKEHANNKNKTKHHNKQPSSAPASASVTTLNDFDASLTSTSLKHKAASTEKLADVSNEHEQQQHSISNVKPNSTDDEHDVHVNAVTPKTPSHGHGSHSHKHREHHTSSSSSRHKSKREHREKKRHSLTDSTVTMTDEEFGISGSGGGGSSATTTTQISNTHRRISTTSDITSATPNTTPTTGRDLKVKTFEQSQRNSERKLSRCSDDGSGSGVLHPNTPTSRIKPTQPPPTPTTRKVIMSSADSDDSEDTAAAKKRSIFEVPDEGPYVSMYDKVKARSCKNMQKQAEEQKIRAKFSQLKKCRAKREGKKRSTSYDGDSDSEFETEHTHHNQHKSRHHGGGGLSTSSDDGEAHDDDEHEISHGDRDQDQDDDDDDIGIIRRRSSHASLSTAQRKFSDSDSNVTAAEDAARRIRMQQNLLRLCDNDESSDDDIRSNVRRLSPSKRSHFTNAKRNLRIASDSESQSQPSTFLNDVKIKQEPKMEQEILTNNIANDVKRQIKQEPHFTLSSLDSDIDLKCKRRSSISSFDGDFAHIKSEDIKKESKASVFFGETEEESSRDNNKTHKIKTIETQQQQQLDYSVDASRKKHKKSKKRQKNTTIQAGLGLLETGVAVPVAVNNVEPINTSMQYISAAHLINATTTATKEQTKPQPSATPIYDAFDELKRQCSKFEASTPTSTQQVVHETLKEEQQLQTVSLSSNTEASLCSEKKRHKDRREKKREKLLKMAAVNSSSVVGSSIDNDGISSAIESSFETEKLTKEERHRLKKAKKSKSLEALRHDSNTAPVITNTSTTTNTLTTTIQSAGKLEDIFGPLSDEEDEDLQFSESECKKLNSNKIVSGANNIVPSAPLMAASPCNKQTPLTPKSHSVEENEDNIIKVGVIGGNGETINETIGSSATATALSDRERLRKEKREKKRREREKSRELQQQKKDLPIDDDENSVDLDEAGRALEAQLMEDFENKIIEEATPSTATTYRSDMTDVFRFSDGDENSIELLPDPPQQQQQQPPAQTHKQKEKKKKKKRSKDEKHHQRRESTSSASNASTTQQQQQHLQQTVSKMELAACTMSPPPTTTTTTPFTGKLTVDIQAATKHSQKAFMEDNDENETEQLPSTPLCKPSPSLPCLIGDDDEEDMLLNRPKLSTPTASQKSNSSTDRLSLSPMREKKMISPIPKTPTITTSTAQDNLNSINTPTTPLSSATSTAAAASSSKIFITPTTPTNEDEPKIIEPLNTTPTSSNPSTTAATTTTIISTPTSSIQKKKPEKFIPGFDGELDEKISESAVQSISAELNTPNLNAIVDDEPKIPIESPPPPSPLPTPLTPPSAAVNTKQQQQLEKHEDTATTNKSRVQISQEETESAVSALLGESFGNTMEGTDFDDAFNDDVTCMDDLSAASANAVDEEAAIAARALETSLKEQEASQINEADDDLNGDEISMAVQSLGTIVDIPDIKPPDTPQSERSLQIDTDTEDTNADEADSSGNSLKIDETIISKAESPTPKSTCISPLSSVITKVTSPLPKNDDLKTSASSSASPIPTTVASPAAAPISKPKEIETSNITSALNATLPSMISLDEPISTTTPTTASISTTSINSQSSVVVSSVSTICSKSEPSKVVFSTKIPTTTSVSSSSMIVAQPTAQLMQPPIITIPDIPVHFAVPQMTASPRSVEHQTNLSPRLQGAMPSLNTATATAAAAAIPQQIVHMRANSPQTATIRQLSPGIAQTAVQQQLSSPITITQTQSQQIPSSTNANQKTSLPSPTIQLSTAPMMTPVTIASNNNKLQQSSPQVSSPIGDQTHLTKAQRNSPINNSMPVTLSARTPTHSPLAKSVIEHSATSTTGQPTQTVTHHGPPMPITLQKMPPVTSHQTIISKVVNVQPQQAQQQLPSPTTVMHMTPNQQQQAVGHIAPISSMTKAITNPYLVQQQQQQQEAHLTQMSNQQHLLQQQQRPTSNQQSKTQQPTQIIQNVMKTGFMPTSSSSSPTQLHAAQTAPEKLTQLSGTVPLSNSQTTFQQQQQQQQQNAIFYRQQQQTAQQKTTSASIVHGQQTHAITTQSIIVQQQIVGRSPYGQVQASQPSLSTTTPPPPQSSSVGGSVPNYISKPLTPSIIIEPLNGPLKNLPNKNSENDKSLPSTQSLMESSESSSAKPVETVSVIRTSPAPNVGRPIHLEASNKCSVSKEEVKTNNNASTTSTTSSNATPLGSVIKKIEQTTEETKKFATTPPINVTAAAASAIPANRSVEDIPTNKLNKEVEKSFASMSSTDHDTEDETETKPQSQTPQLFDPIKVTNLDVTSAKTPRGGGAKRGRQPRGGKKQAAVIPTTPTTLSQIESELGGGVQTRLRKPITVTAPTRGRKGRPPRHALLTQRALEQQLQQELIQQQQQQQQMQINQMKKTQTVEKKTRNQAISMEKDNNDQDVYEFHDDTAEESKSAKVVQQQPDNNEDLRPRLILTIKSPGQATPTVKASEKPSDPLAIPPPIQQQQQEPNVETPKQIVLENPTPSHTQQQQQQTFTQQQQQQAQQIQDEQAAAAAAVQNANNTRKSRRLQEKDRSTIDDIIEDVVRNTQTPPPPTLPMPKGAQTPPRRSGRNVTNPKKTETPTLVTHTTSLPATVTTATTTTASTALPNAVGRPRRSKDRKISGSSEGANTENSNTIIEQQQPQQHQQQQNLTKLQQQQQQQQPLTAIQKAKQTASLEDNSMHKTSFSTQNELTTPTMVTQQQLPQTTPTTTMHIATQQQQHPQHPKKKAIAAAEIESYTAAAAAAAAAININNPASNQQISALPPSGMPMLHTAAPATQKITGGTADVLSKSLIDPVTGLISGMQQGKEGNLPLATAAVKKQQQQPQELSIHTTTSAAVIHKLPSATSVAPTPMHATSGGLHAQQQLTTLPNHPPPPCSIATPITALSKPLQAEAAAPATTLTVPASLANKPVSVVVKTSTTASPVVIQQQIVQQPQSQQHGGSLSATTVTTAATPTPLKQPIVMQQSQLIMHAQHSNVRPPTLKAHVLNSQKQLNSQQQTTLTPITTTLTSQAHHHPQQQQQNQPSTIVISSSGNMPGSVSVVTTAATATQPISTSSDGNMHVIRGLIPTTQSAAALMHQQLLVNVPPAHSPHSGVVTSNQNMLSSPRLQQQQQNQSTLVIKQGNRQISSTPTGGPQVLHVVSSKAALPQQQQQQPAMYHQLQTQTQGQHAYITAQHPPSSNIKQQQQQQQITVLPVLEQVGQTNVHGKHITLQQKQIQPPPTMGISIVAHQQPQQQSSSKQPQQQQPPPQLTQQTLVLPPGMPPHPSMVLQTKSISTAMPAHLHAQQLASSPAAVAALNKQNPTLHNLQTQSTAPILSSSPPSSQIMSGILPAGLKAQQTQASMLAGAPTNMRAAIPSISPQGQARVTPLLLPTGMPVGTFEPNMHDIGKYGGTSSSSRTTQSPPPAHQQQASPITPIESFTSGQLRGVPTRDFMIYQQLLRPQEGAMIRCPEVDEKMITSSPPLELRRPGSVPRTITVPHSLQSPQDRTSDSPQAAQIYVHNARIPPPHPHYPTEVGSNRGFYDASGRPIAIEPPPAHRSATTHIHSNSLIEREREREREQQERLKIAAARENLSTGVVNISASNTSSTIARNMQVATSPKNNQVQLPPTPQPNTDSLVTLLQRYPVMWQGLLALKTDQAAVQMHFVFGNPHVARASLPCNSDGSTPPLRIAQRMRLEQTQLEGVAKKMQYENEHCMLLALPCGRDHADVLQQSRYLQTGFITYLQQKMAAGIVNIPVPGSEQAAYVVHIFPSCDFANENLERAAPDLKNRVAEIAHLLIVIATV